MRAPTASALSDHLRASEKHAETIQEKLAAAIEPILAKAGTDAANRFRSTATDHMTAAAHRADMDALASIAPADARALVASLALISAGDVSPTSTMVALKPTPEEAQAIADATGADPETLHVTLAYLGKTDGDLTPIMEALSAVGATHAPLVGKVGGVGSFGDNGKGAPNILLPSVPGLVELRVAVTQALADADVDFGRDHGFLPHATVSYGDDTPTTDAIGSPLTFGSILVVRGDKLEHEIPLTGVRPITAAASDPDASQPAPTWTAPVGSEVLDIDELVRRITAKSGPVRLRFVESVMAGPLSSAGLSFDATNPYTADVLAKAGAHVQGIAQTTQNDVMNIITASYNQGLTIPETADAIQSGMLESAKVRATMIARTELTAAANGGSLAAARVVSDATGTAYEKVWLTAPGAKYPRHEDYDGLDGQAVTLDADFEVGESEMQYPGDPNGEPEDSINCRCSMRYEDVAGDEVGDEVDAEDGDG